MCLEKKLCHCSVIKNYPLGSTSRIRTGGTALYYAPVSTIDQLHEILFYCRGEKLPFYILGKGSNVLISDEKFNGVVIRLAGNFKTIQFDTQNRTVTAGAGASLMKLGQQIALRGYAGCAYMGVIPGTVGGAVTMNAGTKKEGAIQNIFLSAIILDPTTGCTQLYNKNDMNFDYRTSALLLSTKIVLQATFTLDYQSEISPGEACNEIKKLHSLRRSKQPKNQHTFGSVFKNPPNRPHAAGWYLENVGMKNFRIGEAVVANEHANWIINTGNASANDIKEIIHIGQKRVLEEFGVSLDREVIYLPDDLLA